MHFSIAMLCSNKKFSSFFKKKKVEALKSMNGDRESETGGQKDSDWKNVQNENKIKLLTFGFKENSLYLKVM